MSTEKSVKNQNVFVTLQAVLAFQRDYLQLVTEQQTAREHEARDKESRRHAYESVIVGLGLPIQIVPWLGKKGGR